MPSQTSIIENGVPQYDRELHGNLVYWNVIRGYTEALGVTVELRNGGKFPLNVFLNFPDVTSHRGFAGANPNSLRLQYDLANIYFPLFSFIDGLEYSTELDSSTRILLLDMFAQLQIGENQVFGYKAREKHDNPAWFHLPYAMLDQIIKAIDRRVFRMVKLVASVTTGALPTREQRDPYTLIAGSIELTR